MKRWYESKTIWLGLATIATAVMSAVAGGAPQLFHKSLAVLDDLGHQLVDIAKASAALRVLGGTLASTFSLLGHDPFHDGGFSVLKDIPFDV